MANVGLSRASRAADEPEGLGSLTRMDAMCATAGVSALVWAVTRWWMTSWPIAPAVTLGLLAFLVSHPRGRIAWRFVGTVCAAGALLLGGTELALLGGLAWLL